MDIFFKILQGFIVGLAALTLLLFMAHPITLLLTGLVGTIIALCNADLGTICCFSSLDSDNISAIIITMGACLLLGGVALMIYHLTKGFISPDFYKDTSNLAGQDYAKAAIFSVAASSLLLGPWVFFPEIAASIPILQTLVGTAISFVPPAMILTIGIIATTVVVTACIKSQKAQKAQKLQPKKQEESTFQNTIINQQALTSTNIATKNEYKSVKLVH